MMQYYPLPDGSKRMAEQIVQTAAALLLVRKKTTDHSRHSYRSIIRRLIVLNMQDLLLWSAC